MVTNSRLAVSVHVLAYLAFKQGQPVSSAEIASSVNTHPVIIRRLLILLQRAHLVAAHKGARGGFYLASTPQNITLREVYRAVEPAPNFGMGNFEPNEKCPVGGKIAAALERAFSRAQSQMEAELANVSIADIHREVSTVCTAKK
ncbi:MAG: Rrf2 family transcriptional regulator [Nibricoccus sp.]